MNAARLEHTVGTTYGILGLAAKAEPHLLRATELRERELGRGHPNTLGTMNSLAGLYRVQGRYDESIAYLRQAVDLGWSRASILRDPSFEGLRGNPEFEAIVAEVKERLGK